MYKEQTTDLEFFINGLDSRFGPIQNGVSRIGNLERHIVGENNSGLLTPHPQRTLNIVNLRQTYKGGDYGLSALVSRYYYDRREIPVKLGETIRDGRVEVRQVVKVTGRIGHLFCLDEAVIDRLFDTYSSKSRHNELLPEWTWEVMGRIAQEAGVELIRTPDDAVLRAHQRAVTTASQTQGDCI